MDVYLQVSFIEYSNLLMYHAIIVSYPLKRAATGLWTSHVLKCTATVFISVKISVPHPLPTVAEILIYFNQRCDP
jgi:hypothetical protein